MPRSRIGLAVAGGLLTLALVPSVASAHEITDVQVDCEAQTIAITGEMFAENGGKTVTVTGPEGYIQEFFADQDPSWTVTVPLGPNGDYSIDWPESGDWGPFAFVVDCAEGEVLPATAAPTEKPAEEPEGAVRPLTGEADPTLPPTDTATATAPSEAGSGLQLAILLLGAIITSAAVSLRLAEPERRPRDR